MDRIHKKSEIAVKIKFLAVILLIVFIVGCTNITKTNKEDSKEIDENSQILNEYPDYLDNALEELEQTAKLENSS
ncbi:hypothetical protein HYX17_02820 [Candidatus Woesearchaeota archaeon]|nr:hypothetical protein [Candidatus Woesearchaeota archaeon]